MYSKREKFFMSIWFVSLLWLFMSTYAYQPIDTILYDSWNIVSTINNGTIIEYDTIKDIIEDNNDSSISIKENLIPEQTKYVTEYNNISYNEITDPNNISYNEITDPNNISYNEITDPNNISYNEITDPNL
jgi:hypothetical protein